MSNERIDEPIVKNSSEAIESSSEQESKEMSGLRVTNEDMETNDDSDDEETTMMADITDMAMTHYIQENRFGLLVRKQPFKLGMWLTCIVGDMKVASLV